MWHILLRCFVELPLLLKQTLSHSQNNVFVNGGWLLLLLRLLFVFVAVDFMIMKKEALSFVLLKHTVSFHEFSLFTFDVQQQQTATTIMQCRPRVISPPPLEIISLVVVVVVAVVVVVLLLLAAVVIVFVAVAVAVVVAS